MRRILALGLLAVSLALGGLLVAARGRGPEPVGYRVDVIFDNGKGLLPGQLVKVAGAKSGAIVDVTVTDDYKARVQLRVDERFAPFSSDARCSIQPEGLIGENFVQCDPGTRGGRELAQRGDDAPTIPVKQTTTPVSFPELFNLATVPVRQRFTVVLNELGLATAARGEDLNAVLERANPTLGLVRKLGRTLDRQRTQISTALRTTDKVAAELARRKRRVGELVTSSARVSTTVASRRGELRQTVRGLPPLLRETRGTLTRLDTFLDQGAPLLRSLRRAAPNLGRAVGELTPFARAARPALRDLGAVSVTGRRAIRRTRPTVTRLRRFARIALPAGKGLNAVLVDARDRGVVEGLLGGFYTTAVTLARFDDTSHLLPLRTTITSCTPLASTPVPGCSTRYGGEGAPAARRAGARTRTRRGAAASALPSAPTDASTAKAGRDRVASELLDFLLG